MTSFPGLLDLHLPPLSDQVTPIPADSLAFLAGTPASLSQQESNPCVESLSAKSFKRICAQAPHLKTKDLFPEDSMFDLPGPFS